jgi:hypothetical protein
MFWCALALTPTCWSWAAVNRSGAAPPSRIGEPLLHQPAGLVENAMQSSPVRLGDLLLRHA